MTRSEIIDGVTRLLADNSIDVGHPTEGQLHAAFVLNRAARMESRRTNDDALKTAVSVATEPIVVGRSQRSLTDARANWEQFKIAKTSG